MSFLTRSALLAGSSLKNGAKVSVTITKNMKVGRLKAISRVKLKVKIPRKKRLNNRYDEDLECGHLFS